MIFNSGMQTKMTPRNSFLNDISGVYFLFRRFFKPYSSAIGVLVALNVVTGILQAALPLSIAPAVNIILGENNPPAAAWDKITLDNLGPSIMAWLGYSSDDFFMVMVVVASLYVGVTFLVASLRTGAHILSSWVTGTALADLIIALHAHILRLPLSFYNSKQQGDVLSRFVSDTSATVNLLDGLIRGVLQTLIQAIFLLIILFRTDPYLSLATIGIGGGHFIITKVLGGWVRRRVKKVYDFYGRMTSALQESLQNIRVTKCFAAEPFDHGRLVREAQSVKQSLFRFRIARFAEDPLRMVADAFSISAMLFLAYYAMKSGHLSKSGFGLFIFLTSRVVVPISEFSKHFLSIFAVAGSADRILELFGIKTSMVDGDNHAQKLQQAIRFEQVSFSHSQDVHVLKDIALEIKRGEMVAIVGQSGGGKSTLCDMLLRLHDPEKGRILYDGEDIRRFRRSSYIQHFGVVPQENLLLNSSVRENVLYGRPWDSKCFEHAIAIANAYEFIETLPNKEETLIGDRGVLLSGGQRQRLAIARAVYGQPELLILDEATSALDSVSEKLVQEAIEKATQGMTTVVVAHRLSTVRHADKIVLIEDGKIAASGTHDELLSKSEEYRNLCQLQFGSDQ